MKTITCPRCNGDGYITVIGWIESDLMVVCPMCQGEKRVRADFAVIARRDDCDECGLSNVYTMPATDGASNEIRLCWRCWRSRQKERE